MKKKVTSSSAASSHRMLLEYQIKPVDIAAQKLNITLTLSNLPQTRIFTLYQGALTPTNLYCRDQYGQKLFYQQLSEHLQIITNGLTIFTLQYDITIGQLAKHGHQGRLTTDFLTCSGENILLLPVTLASCMTDEDVQQCTAAITLFFDVPKDWSGILPFGSPSSLLQSRTVHLSNPSWSAIRELLKSCYTLGHFRAHSASHNPELRIFTPQGASNLQTSQTYTGIRCLYEYYSGLFEVTPKLALVLLERDCWDQNYILGGAGSQTIGTTFQPEKLRDWELLAHRFFHAFFDTQVTSNHFHQAPQAWFYEGLATYYENVALDALPRNLKIQLGVDSQSSFAALFQRYLYFRLKEPQLLALVPMTEAQINSGGMIEFLHYTQAPLLIKFWEDTSVNMGQQCDSIVKFILKSHDRDLAVQQIISGVLGEISTKKIQPYLYHTELIPLWYLKSSLFQDDSTICQQLTNYSHTLWSWFRLDGINYQIEHVGLCSLEEKRILAPERR